MAIIGNYFNVFMWNTCLVEEISQFRMGARFYQRFDKQNAPYALTERNNVTPDVPELQFVVRAYQIFTTTITSRLRSKMNNLLMYI